MKKNTPTAATDFFYPVLTPFKFKGTAVKPPAFVQMSADEAEPYLAAQVIGKESVLPPEVDDEAKRLEAERIAGNK